MRLQNLRTFLLILIGIILGLYLSRYINSNEKKTILSFIDVDKSPVSQAFEIMRGNYVEDIDVAKISEAMIQEMMDELDPHSTYISKKDVKEQQENMKGEFSGIGVQFTMYRDTVYVLQAIPGGPSEKLGIRAGDKIIKIEDSTIAGVKDMSTNYIVSRLKGKKGTKVNISIKRKKEKDLLVFTITRDKIPIYSIDAAFKLHEDIGYIKLNRFSATTSKEFLEKIHFLKKNATEKFVIDLRGNGGGYLSEVVSICNEILNSNDLIVYTEGKRSPREEFYSEGNGILSSNEIIVLLDEQSASASEILAGAIQDNDRGILIGRRTFGKGLVQKTYPLKDGSIMALTVAKYYTPSGRNIQRPYELSNQDDYYSDFVSRYNNGELFSMDSILVPDSLKFKTKSGRVVYGGGGIIPDYFISIDTTMNSDYQQKILYSGALSQFVLEYVDNNRTILKKHKSVSSYMTNFKITNSLLKSMVSYANKEFKISPDPEGLSTSKPQIIKMLKALIARQAFNNEAYYKVMAEEDIMIEKAIKVFNREI